MYRVTGSNRGACTSGEGFLWLTVRSWLNGLLLKEDSVPNTHPVSVIIILNQ